MFKSILLFLLILAVSAGVGVGIFHLIQPSGQLAFRSGAGNFGGDFGGERGGRNGFNLIGGLFGVSGNLMLVAFITFIVVSVQSLFAKHPEPAKSR